MNLYLTHHPLDTRLTLGLLRQYIEPETPLWISIEPRAWLPERDGQRKSGRLSGLAPLARALPNDLDDLPLLAASLFEADRWRHFHDAQPLSGIPGQCLTWSLTPSADAQTVEGLLCQRQQVLPWQDRQRFGLRRDDTLTAAIPVEHYYRSGRRLAWRLVAVSTEENT